MKKTFPKIISSLLSLSFLVSAFGFFSFANEEISESENETFNLEVYRTFDEGWDIDNGLRKSGSLEFSVDHEEHSDFTYNYFARIKCTEKAEGYMESSFKSIPYSGGAVMEFDFKIDSYTDFGVLAYFLSGGNSTTRAYQEFLNINDNILGVFNFKIGMPRDWMHLAFVFDFDTDLYICTHCNNTFEKSGNEIKCKNKCNGDYREACNIRLYFSNSNTFDYTSAEDANALSGKIEDFKKTYYVDFNMWSGLNMPASLSIIRMGCMKVNSSEAVKDQSYCIDNFKLYYDTKPKDENGNPCKMYIRKDLEEYGYGSAVSTSKNKTVPIIGGSQNRDYIKEGIVMKTGSNYMLYKGNRLPIRTNRETGEAFGAPIKINGEVFVSLEAILNSTGYPILMHDDGITYEIATAGGNAVLTLNRSSALVNGKITPLVAAPTIVRDKESGNAYPAICIKDIETLFDGYYVTYDEMGVIAITQSQTPVFNREENINYILELLKQFVFDYYDGDAMYRIVSDNTNGFDHPYLIAKDCDFEYMNAVYNEEEENPTYREWLLSFVQKAEKNYQKYTTLPDPQKVANHTYLTKPKRFKLLAFEITNPHDGIKDGEVWTDNPNYTYVSGPDENGEYWPSYAGGKNNGKNYNNGLDLGNRNYQCYEYYAAMIRELALVYRITEDIKYARLAYELIISFTDSRNWPHWCDVGEFLITSETGSAISLAFDWCYDAFDSFDDEYYETIGTTTQFYDLDYVAQQIYERVIKTAYDKTKGGTTSFLVWKINWNAVCTTGIVISALAIMGESGDSIDFDENDGNGNRVKWAIESPIKTLIKHGLDIYAPDGSYIESPSYWSFATNNLSMLMWAIDTAVGDDLGFYELAGFDKTFYYALQVEFRYNSQNKGGYGVWGYHDGGTGTGQGQHTGLFFFASRMLDDEGLAAIRLQQIEAGKNLYWQDIVGYKKEFMDLSTTDISLDKDYLMEACDAVVARSSWDEDALYVGVMGNANNCTDHGQIDSGNFIYVNRGYYWFCDLGSDNYNAYNYFGHYYGSPRYNYYRNNGEGHNVIILTSQQDKTGFINGQYFYDGGKIEKLVSENAGMYTVLDNSGAYGDLTNFARRGILLTNNRETTIIQDEIAFKGIQSVVWIAHTTASISLSGDKRTAFLHANVNGKSQILRASIISSNSRLKFSTMAAGLDENSFLLDSTNRPNYSISNGGVAEQGRKAYERLIIKADNTLSFECAVVLEIVGNQNQYIPVKYDYTPISRWEISESYENNVINQELADSNIITNSKLTDIHINTSNALKLYNAGYAFTTRPSEFFKSLARVQAAVNTYRPESFANISAINKSYLEFLTLKSYYDAYRNEINSCNKAVRGIAARFIFY